MKKAKIAYDAYRERSGGKSAYSGDPLPEFESLSPLIKECWRAAAAAVEYEVVMEQASKIVPIPPEGKKS